MLEKVLQSTLVKVGIALVILSMIAELLHLVEGDAPKIMLFVATIVIATGILKDRKNWTNDKDNK